MHHVMNQEAHFHQKFTNMNSHWVNVGGSFLPAPSNVSNNVEHLNMEPRSNYVLGNCLKNENFSCGFDYGMQTSRGGPDSNTKQGGEHELKFGDFDQLLDDVNEVEEFHATNNLPNTYIEVAENASRRNMELHFGDSSSESKSQRSRSKNDAFGMSEFSGTMVLESECNNKAVAGLLTHELSSVRRSEHRCVTPVEGSICSTSLDFRYVQRDTNESRLKNAVFSDGNVNDHVEGSKLASSSRERRLRKPTRRYIEEFADSKSEIYKGRRNSPIKDKLMKVAYIEKSNHIEHKAQMLMPGGESFCGATIPVQSRTQRGRPRKHIPVSGFLSEDESSTIGSRDVHLSSKRFEKYDRRKHQKMWTLTEVMRLVDGIAEYGTGRWTHIKKNLFASSAYRTPIDLRDKWRNLLRASCVYMQNKKGIEQKQLHASRPLPKSLLQRVYELAHIHPYPKGRNPKPVKETAPPIHLIESDSLSFNWGRKKSAWDRSTQKLLCSNAEV